MIECKIVIIGFNCCGKTTVGQNLSKKIEIPFIDVDSEIVKYTGLTITEIFKQEGEIGFRKIEKEFSYLLENARESVICTNAGIVSEPESIKKITKKAKVIYLKATKETVINNLKKGDVSSPLLSVENLEEKVMVLLNERLPLYERYSDKTVVVDGRTIEDIVNEILEELKNEN